MIKINSFSFQGVKGAYSELAGINLFPDAKSLSCATFEDMFEQVRIGNVDAAMVPIENSLAGRVADTQRLIPESNLKITFEYFLEVNHNLMAVKGSSLSSIKEYTVTNKVLLNVEII